MQCVYTMTPSVTGHWCFQASYERKDCDNSVYWYFLTPVCVMVWKTQTSIVVYQSAHCWECDIFNRKSAFPSSHFHHFILGVLLPSWEWWFPLDYGCWWWCQTWLPRHRGRCCSQLRHFSRCPDHAPWFCPQPSRPRKTRELVGERNLRTEGAETSNWTWVWVITFSSPENLTKKESSSHPTLFLEFLSLWAEHLIHPQTRSWNVHHLKPTRS